MSGIEEFKQYNESEHRMLSDRIKSISFINKALMLLLLTVFSVMLTILLSINRYTEKAYNVRVKTFDMVKILQKSADKNYAWIHKIYDKEISKNTLRSKENKIKINKLESWKK